MIIEHPALFAGQIWGLGGGGNRTRIWEAIRLEASPFYIGFWKGGCSKNLHIFPRDMQISRTASYFLGIWLVSVEIYGISVSAESIVVLLGKL